MQITPLNFKYYQNFKAGNAAPLSDGGNKSTPAYDLSLYNTKGYSLCTRPLAFRGACNNLRKMAAYSPDGTSYVLRKSKDGSYLADSETVTKVYYGKDAQKYLDSKTVFDLETQIIVPRDCEIEVTADGNTIPVDDGGSITLSKGREAKIKVLKGNPLVITSEREPVWYKKYGKNFTSQFNELTYLNFHTYSGHIKISDIGEETAYKLIEANQADQCGEDHISMKNYFEPDFQKEHLSSILDKEELDVFMHHYRKARKIRSTTKMARMALAEDLDPKLKKKLIEKRFIVDIDRSRKNQIYWVQLFGNESELKTALSYADFTRKETEEAAKFWKRSNKLGFDFSGLKYLSQGLAIYDLEDKFNNWSTGKTEWCTHSNIVSGSGENVKSPYIGVSKVSARKEYETPVSFKTIRNAEALHSHPALIDKRQTELYIITEGIGAITVIADDKPKTIILRQGEGIIIQPGVKHCMSAAKGNYEHLCCQIPSTFQYGFGFKIGQEYPEGYSEKSVNNMALEKLEALEA